MSLMLDYHYISPVSIVGRADAQYGCHEVIKVQHYHSVIKDNIVIIWTFL